jgi:hypothetical protein
MKRSLWLLALVTLTGCPGEDPEADVRLIQSTGAPPTLQARVDTSETASSLKVSTGVAMAVSCWDSCVDSTTSCEGVSIAIENPEVLDAREIFRNGRQQQGDYVLSGRSAGATNVTITTACGSRVYRAFVE